MALNTEFDEELVSIMHHFSLDDKANAQSPSESEPESKRVGALTNGTSASANALTSEEAVPPSSAPVSAAVSGPALTAHKIMEGPIPSNGPSPHKPIKSDIGPKMNRNHGSDDYSSLERRVNALSNEVSRLLDRIYEIQELRHFSVSSLTLTSPASAPPTTELDTLLSGLSASTTRLRPEISILESTASAYSGPRATGLKVSVNDLLNDWKRVEEQQKMLSEEMREDGWLIRFRTTADQAEAMMNPLQKSSIELSHYVERISSDKHIPFISEYDDQPSVQQLQKLAKGHDSLMRTYVPSIMKILKMMDKNIAERSIKNGEALRRFGEMSQRWTTLQKQLNHLDGRVQSIISRHAQNGYVNRDGDVELLSEIQSPYSSPDSRGDYFGYGTPKSRESTASFGLRSRESTFGSSSRPSPSHQSSISSGISTSSARSAVRPSDVPPPLPAKEASQSTLSPTTAMRPAELRKRASMLSTTSSTTTTTRSPIMDRPRWNSSPKVPEPSSVQTPTMPRRTSFLPRSASPTPSNTSLTSTTSRRLSRIPVSSPFGKGVSVSSPGVRSTFSSQDGEEVFIPGLTVSNSSTRTRLTEPSSVNRKQVLGQGQTQAQGKDHLERARFDMKTPEQNRPRMSSTFSAFSPTATPSRSNGGGDASTSTSTSGRVTPSMGTRTFSSGPSTTPRSTGLSGRQSMARAPPSSFRVTSPAPSNTGPAGVGARPSSRLSTMSYSNFNSAALEDFVPSKFDLLDQEVQRIIDEVGFNLFVARLDALMKRGQRRRDDEEWKGEYVFGRGEKPTSVKLLMIAGQRPGMEKRVKTLVRVGGAWHDLRIVLERRKDEMESF